ncbi:MAG: thermonuclease family protein [Gammaproteobacteria bacterium]|nr:thermonuclease family protein [Gammaproteobacteria bacterium]
MTNSAKNTASSKPCACRRVVSSNRPAVLHLLFSQFRYSLLLLLFPALAAAEDASLCPADQPFDQTVTVSRVIDGDTVLLSDGRKLRFAAINAPELTQRNRQEEPGALQAKQALQHWLADNPQLQLRLDESTRDPYQRLLAHPFLADGQNLQALMLQQGLAAHIVDPNSLWAHRCYAALEKHAQQQQLGMWASPRFAAIATDRLGSHDHGFYRISGKVEKVWSSNRTTWLQLSDRVSLRIEDEDLKYFKNFSLEALRSHEIEAKGWLFPYRNGLNLRIKHPGALRILD